MIGFTKIFTARRREMTAFSFQIVPLPGGEGDSGNSTTDTPIGLLSGFYGLERTFVRGRVLVGLVPGRTGGTLSGLSLALIGQMDVRLPDMMDELDLHSAADNGGHRQRTLFETRVCLLPEPETLSLESMPSLDIPFEFEIPSPSTGALFYDQEESTGTAVGPSSALYPPSISIHGMAAPPSSTVGHRPYEGRIHYSLSLTVSEPGLLSRFWPISASSISHSISTTTLSFTLADLVLYDPRLVPHLLYPEIRRWRSAPGSSPLEYDIEVGSQVLGPLDRLHFGYRLHMAPEASRAGVRIKRVTFTLREHHVLGDITYRRHRPGWKNREKDPTEEEGEPELVHRSIRKTVKCKAPVEILKWEQEEYIPETSDGNFELRELCQSLSWMPSTSSLKSLGAARPGALGGGGDGIYAESLAKLHIPPLGQFQPSTFKYDPDADLTYMRWPNHSSIVIEPLLEIRHSIQVKIEFFGHDRILMESGVILSSVSRTECEAILDLYPEIVPALDYEKVVGTEIWVPEYTEKDSISEALRNISLEALDAIAAVVSDNQIQVGEGADRQQVETRSLVEESHSMPEEPPGY